MALPVKVSRGLSASPLDIIHRDIDSVLGSFFGGRDFFGDGGLAAGPLGVDICEDPDHIYVDADLPGFKKDEVDVSLEGGTLTITAEKREEQKGKKERRDEGDYLLRERRYERYQRSFTLPQNVDDQNVNAKLEDGCLCITLNKTEQSKRKRIPLA
jgi:HSP20 family molecular chaperone IbpA